LKVVLGTFKDKGEELATFLEPRVGAKPEVSGDSLEIEDGSIRQGVKPRHVKTYIKRFLFMNGARKKYRVFVTGRELMVQEIELEEEEEEEKKEKKAQKKPEEAPVEEEKATPEEGGEEKEPEAPEPVKEEVAEEKPKAKKAAPKKPRASKKKASAE
jgi:hypothetical protein